MLGEQDTRLALLLPVYRYAIHQVGYLQADVEAAGFYDVRRGTIEPPVQGVQRYCSSKVTWTNVPIWVQYLPSFWTISRWLSDKTSQVRSATCLPFP
jgi:hypothetical protein